MKKTALAYIPILCLSLLWANYLYNEKTAQLIDSQKAGLILKKELLLDLFNPLVKSTVSWRQDELLNFLGDTTLNVDKIAMNMRLIYSFDQFRIIDKSGQEQIRFVKGGDSTFRSKKQNKAKEIYFQKAMALDTNEIYVSEINLNLENEQIERPFKPVIRTAKPIIDKNGHQGIMVINFRVGHILKLLEEVGEASNFYLLDQNSQYIISDDTSKNFALQKSHIDLNFKSQFPTIWPILEKVNQDTSFLLEGEIWSFQKISLNELLSPNEGQSIVGLKDKYLVGHINENQLYAQIKHIYVALISFNILAIVSIIIIVYLIRRRELLEKRYIQTLESKAEILQGYQNSLEERIQQLEESSRILAVRNRQQKDMQKIIAHDLKSHTTGLKLISDRIIKNPISENVQTLMPMIDKTTYALQELTYDIGSHIKIINGTKILNNVDIKQIINLAIDQVSIDDCHFDLDDFEWEIIKSSEDYLKEVFIEFLINSNRFRKPDKTLIIRFSTFLQNSNKVLTYSDNGLGLDLSVHGDNLFKLNKAFHKKLSQKGSGLFMVKSKLDMLNAKIEADSKLGNGILFKIEFF